MKAPRLFVYSETETNGEVCYCGGPDVPDALEGLKNMLEGSVDNLLRNGGTCAFTLRVTPMSNAEVDALPDI